MNWTTIAPTEPGWYWMREKGKEPEVVRLEACRHSELLLYRNGTDEDSYLSDFLRYSDAPPEWMGPLEVPK